MKNQKTRIKNGSFIKELLNTIFMLFFIQYIVHFTIVMPYSNIETNDIFNVANIRITVLFSLPFQMYYIYNRYKKFKNNRLNSTYSKVEGIDYYRDKLKSVSPALMSFLVNLEIEEEKDIKATLLYYEAHNLIKIENNEIIQNPNHLALTESDKKFFEYLNNKSIKNYNLWKGEVVREALNAKYVKKKDASSIKKLLIKRKITIIILAITLTISNFYWTFQKSYGPLNILDNNEILTKLSMLIAYVVMLYSFIALIVLLVKGEKSIFSNGNSIYERTSKGDQLTEQIHGLKNFIHDFSILEEATKKQLVLWNDFLIYATILEENSIIIDEITEYKAIQS